MSLGITLDTGALIALERRQASMRGRMHRARLTGTLVTVPAVVLIEWWRAGFGSRHAEIIAWMTVEATTARIAKIAGEALTSIDASPVDAAVMASAALRGDAVYTSDVGDLMRLQSRFPGVRVFSVT